MPEHEALRELLQQFMAGAYTPISRLGFFCTPFVAGQGIWRGKVIKIFRGLKNRTIVERLSDQHFAYLNELRTRGIRVPATQMHVFPESNVYYPIVVQEFFGSTELVRALMLKASPSAAAELMLRCLEIINQFWKANWR